VLVSCVGQGTVLVWNSTDLGYLDGYGLFKVFGDAILLSKLLV